jgi:peptidoglycan/LPS O-acetylase OafA/YrhL
MVIEGQIAPARRYETLGAFRFILAFMVFYGHMTIMVVRHDPSRHFNLQNAGVSLFFLLSGYIIFSSYDKFYQGRPTRYLANRFVRIYPPFWAVYFLTIIPVLMSGHSEVQGYTFGDVVSDATLIGNYLGISTLAPMQQTWSLLVELQFYLMAFFFFLILERFPSRRLAEAIFLILTAALYVYVWQTASFNRFFGGAQWAPFFAMGIAVYYVKRDGLRNWLAVIAVAVFCVLALH